jgi:hypothetical protein
MLTLRGHTLSNCRDADLKVGLTFLANVGEVQVDRFQFDVYHCKQCFSKVSEQKKIYKYYSEK